MPLNYSATATAGGGNVLHCLTEGSSCTLANLQCGKSYNVTVRAISDTCEGQSGVPEIVNSSKFGLAVWKYRKPPQTILLLDEMVLFFLLRVFLTTSFLA